MQVLACLLKILFFILKLVFCRVKSYGNDMTIDLSSSSSINIQCETTLKKLFDFELFLISINLCPYPDAPGAPELTLEDEAFKGGDVQMTCFLENRGNPDAERFVWTK